MGTFVRLIGSVAGLTAAIGIAAAHASAEEALLEPCLAAAADYSPVYPTQTFPSPVRELSAVFRLREGETYGTLTATWIAADVAAAAPPGYQIATSRLDLKGMRAGRFRYDQPQPMPVGRYRLDVAADGKPWKSAEFAVVPAVRGVTLQRPEDLLPLSPGQSWTYAFTQHAGKGVRVNLPDVPPDADGVYRATVTMTVAGRDDAAAHIEMRRNETLVYETWWRLDARGLAATKRRQRDEVTTLEPPQLLLPLPLGASQGRDDRAEDGSASQSYETWGPVPVEGPDGEALGYVVLVKQPPRSPVATVERHFLPGVGMVREVIVQAPGGRMLSRQEMVLTGHRE